MALGACLWVPAGAYALGMGDISVQSALNEPLKAEIKLLATTPAELEGLTVQLATNAAFEKLGVERTPALANIVFEVIKQGRGAPYVKLSSNRAIREPFLDFVVTVNWANGQMLREYTLLLDPPVFDAEEKAMPVEAPTTGSAKIEREQPVVVAPRAQPVAPSAAVGSYGPTQRTDTLWTIAKRMRSNDSVGIAQMMVALVKENPEAFMGGNVNGLKAGYILRAPEMDVIGALSKDEAVAETNRQYQQWLASGHRGSNVMAGVRQEVAGQQAATAAESTPATSSAVAPNSAATPSANARLKLVTPDETQTANGLGGTGKSGKGGSLQKELAIAQETAEAMRQENTDLHNRVAELEKQIQAMQRLITLKDDTFSALQSGVTQGTTPQVGAATPETVGPEVAQPSPAAPTPKPKPVSQPEPEQSFVDQLLADPKLLGLAVGIPLLLVLGVVAYLRKRRQGAVDEPIPGGVSFESLVAAKSQTRSSAAPAAAATVSSTPGNEFESAVAGVPEYSTSDIGSIHTEEADIDPVAEADVYLAYRRYEQAEVLLKEAIRNHPDRSELRLKLMEIYHTTKNKEAFEAQAESLYAMAGGQGNQVWSQAIEMGRELCPEHPLFAEAGAAVAAVDAEPGATSGADNNLEFDVSAASATLSDADLAASLDVGDMNALDTKAGDALNLNLDLPGEINFDLGTEPTVAKNTDLDSSLEQRADDLLSSLVSDETVAAESVVGLGESSEWTLEAAVSEFGGLDLKSEMPPEEHVAVTPVDAEHVEVNKNWGLEETAAEMGDVTVVAEQTSVANQEWNLDEAVSQFGPIEEELESTVFDSSDDVVGTKLDLAKAYIDMGDQAGARTILDEVVVEGSEMQRQEAQHLIQQIG
ncbi:MAG: FimV family protein [Gammaproteobacteria bacterium]|nr:FimV family protein [Gammaproteobacteria bacterium]